MISPVMPTYARVDLAFERRQLGPVVGEAYRFLMERRLDEGPLGPERARAELLVWWAARAAAGSPGSVRG